MMLPTIQAGPRQQLAEQVEAFLAGGGRVEQVAGFMPAARPRRHHPEPVAKPRRRRLAAPKESYQPNANELKRAKLVAALPRLLELATTSTVTQAARLTGFSRSALTTFARDQGFSFLGRNLGVITPQLDERIRELAPTHHLAEVSRLIGISRCALQHYAKKTGVAFADGTAAKSENRVRTMLTPEAKARYAERMRALSDLGASASGEP